jgi:hypothetical protein
LLDNCPGFECFQVNIVADHSNKICVSYEVLYELLQENEYSDILESEYSNDSNINVKFIRRA